MLANIKMVKCMVMAPLLSKVVTNMKDSGRKATNLGKEFSLSQTVPGMKENGEAVNCTAKEPSILRVEINT